MKNTSLPENAYRELREGEEYKPIMSAETTPAEATPYSVTMGIIMAIIFSAAAAFLGLKVGQVFEAAIPIAIIAVGLGGLHKGKSMLGQNVIIQSIGATSQRGMPMYSAICALVQRSLFSVANTNHIITLSFKEYCKNFAFWRKNSPVPWGLF